MSISKVFAVFYKYLLKNKPLFGFFLLLVIVSNIAMNLNPYFYQLFVKAIPSLEQNYLINLLFIFIAVRLFGVITDLLAFYVGDVVLFEAAKNARLDIFKHVQNLDFSYQ